MKRSAFTLLEIIIVIIIIGVLTSLALPRLFSMVEGANAAEALSVIPTLRLGVERYSLMRGGAVGYGIPVDFFANMWDYLGIDDPNNDPGRRFAYAVFGPDPDQFFIAAVRNCEEGGGPFSGGSPSMDTLNAIIYYNTMAEPSYTGICGFGNYKHVRHGDSVDCEGIVCGRFGNNGYGLILAMASSLKCD